MAPHITHPVEDVAGKLRRCLAFQTAKHKCEPGPSEKYDFDIPHLKDPLTSPHTQSPFHGLVIHLLAIPLRTNVSQKGYEGAVRQAG